MTLEVEDICRRGYFPKEVPPAFTTDGYSRYIKANHALSKYSRWTYPVRFNLGRAGGLRRKLSIPHPASFLEIARTVVSNWSELNRVYQSSEVINTSPLHTPQSSRRCFFGELTYPARPLVRAKRRSQARFVTCVDISQCYASIYTHSFSWALASKASAKAAIGSSGFLGNDLDQATRYAQGGQTMGIPIGPDTSLALAELILSAIDARFASSMAKHSTGGGLPALRMIDDFEYYARTRDEAEDALLAWELAASHFELNINPTKTFILELPYDLETPWAVTLSQFQFDRSSVATLQNDLVNFFSQAFELASRFKEDGVISRAISIATRNGLAADPRTSSTFMDLLLPAMIAEPSSLKYGYRSLGAVSAAGRTINRTVIQKTLNEIVRFHAPLEHGSEVAWAIFLLHQLSCKLESPVATNLANMEDNICLILLSEMVAEGLIDGAVPDMGKVIQRAEMSGVEADTDWLLAYESAAHRWTSGSQIQADTWLGPMLAAGVRFLDFSAMPAGSLLAREAGEGEEVLLDWDEDFHEEEDASEDFYAR